MNSKAGSNNWRKKTSRDAQGVAKNVVFKEKQSQDYIQKKLRTKCGDSYIVLRRIYAWVEDSTSRRSARGGLLDDDLEQRGEIFDAPREQISLGAARVAPNKLEIQ
uniref:Uncharacterized protein n=1 Tax=Romanomermis culicivorax TaxID=13658 RepID=A0A915KLK8_ROMCU